MSATDRRLDPLTQAMVTIAWVIVANKPFYPVYVWYLVGSGVAASLWTLAAAPLFLTIPVLAKRSTLAARIALPLIGTLDTWFETKLFGHRSGTELFFAACIMLAAMSFHADEKWWQRGMAAFVFAVFFASRAFMGAPLHVWSESNLATLFSLNAFAVASLTTFVALRYAGFRRD